MLELKLIEPSPIQPVRIRMGEMIPVTATVLADNISSCEVLLRFDQDAFQEIGGSPNPWRFAGSTVAEHVRWKLQASRTAVRTFVTVEAQADGLFQKSEFAVEITR